MIKYLKDFPEIVNYINKHPKTFESLFDEELQRIYYAAVSSNTCKEVSTLLGLNAGAYNYIASKLKRIVRELAGGLRFLKEKGYDLNKTGLRRDAVFLLNGKPLSRISCCGQDFYEFIIPLKDLEYVVDSRIYEKISIKPSMGEKHMFVDADLKVITNKYAAEYYILRLSYGSIPNWYPWCSICVEYEWFAVKGRL